MVPKRRRSMGAKTIVKKVAAGSRRKSFISIHMSFRRPRIRIILIPHLFSRQGKKDIFQARLLGAKVAKAGFGGVGSPDDTDEKAVAPAEDDDPAARLLHPGDARNRPVQVHINGAFHVEDNPAFRIELGY